MFVMVVVLVPRAVCFSIPTSFLSRHPRLSLATTLVPPPSPPHTMTSLSFCPPPMQPKSLLTQAHLLPTTSKLSHATLVGSVPLTATHISSPSPTPTLVSTPSPAPPPAPPLKRKRVVHPDGHAKKRKAGPSPPIPRSRSPTSTVRPDDSDSDADFDYSVFAQQPQTHRRSTPVVREGSFAFGAREDWTLHREIRTEDRRQQLRCGIEEDGRVDALSSEQVVRNLLGRYYKTCESATHPFYPVPQSAPESLTTNAQIFATPKTPQTPIGMHTRRTTQQ